MFSLDFLLRWIWLPALASLGWILSQMPLSTIGHTVATLVPSQWLGWLALNAIIIGAAVRRWQVFSEQLGAPIGFSQLLKIRQAGQTVSFVTPGPQFGGEPLQIYWLHNHYRTPLAPTLLALALDRYYELFINCSILTVALGLLLVSPFSATANWLATGMGLATSLAAVGWIALGCWRNPEALTTVLNSWSQQWPQRHILQTLAVGWQAVAAVMQEATNANKTLFLPALALSMLAWTGLLAELWLLLDMVGAGGNAWRFLLILTAMRLAFLVPLPGGIGSLEAAILWVCQYLTLLSETAVGLLALMRLRDAVLLIIGSLCLAALHVDQSNKLVG